MTGRTTALLLAAAFCAVPWSRGATPQDLPAADPTTLIRELEAAEQKHKTSSSVHRSDIYAALGRAAAGGADAADLYEEAVKNAGSEHKTGKGKKNGDEKAKNPDFLRSEQLQSAVAFQARYLLIGLQLRESGKKETAADASFAYARDYVRQFSDEKFMRLPEPADNLLQKPASDGPLSKWMFLGGELPQGESWEPAAGNLEGILEKNVRPVWRKNSDPRLSSTWDLQIEFQGAMAGAGGSDFEREKFQTLVKPRLLFGRAVDRIFQGQPNMAASEILALIKKYPTHPDWPSWAEKLRLSLRPAPTTASPAGE
jgi:hypothetical protein